MLSTKKYCLSRGFTLIELMITIVVISVLAMIAIPTYQNYITRSRARAASADLVALGLAFENSFQKTLVYPNPIAAADALSSVASLRGWTPAESSFFSYSAVSSDGASYTLTATGTGMMSACTLTLNSSNTRTATDGCKLGSTSW